MRHRVAAIVVIAAVFSVNGWVEAQDSSISRGHRLLLEHGLQIQAWVFPGWVDPGETPTFDLGAWAASNLTTAVFIDASGEASDYLGAAPGVPWGMAGWGLPSSSEGPYLPNLVCIQFGDEQNLNDDGIVAQAVAVIEQYKNNYPDALVYTNQIGNQFTTGVMQNYMAKAKPDMLMFDTYPFNGTVDLAPGGSPTSLYGSLAKYRALGLAGNDGTGREPIPCGLYTQTFTMPRLNNHVVTESEMRLNQFLAWAFGFKAVTCFFYDRPGPEQDGLETILFDGPTSADPRTDRFYQLAELNRQSRNLGPALLRLLSTDVRFVLGRYKRTPTEGPTSIPRISEMSLWSPGQTVPYLTSVQATNLGTENDGLEGNVILGGFKPLDESYDGMHYANEAYFMVVNGLSSPKETGTAANTRQRIRLTFDFGGSNITGLQRWSRETGEIEPVPLVHEGGSAYSLALELDGGTGDLFKFATGAPFVADPAFGGDIISSHGYFVAAGDRVTLQAPAGAASYTWMRDGVVVADGGGIQGSSGDTLVLDPAAEGHSGTYICQMEGYGAAVTQSTTPYTVEVVPAESLPVGAPALCGGLIVALIVLAGRRLSRRESLS